MKPKVDRKKEKLKNTYLYVYITEKQKDKIEELALEKGTTLSALMRNVIDDYIKRAKPAWS